MQLADGFRIRVASGNESQASGQVSVCLRPQNITLVADENGARELTDRGYNLFSGIVRRSIYFGDAVDYTIELPSRTFLRVIAPPSQRFQPGESIRAAAHPDHCVVVREE